MASAATPHRRPITATIEPLHVNIASSWKVWRKFGAPKVVQRWIRDGIQFPFAAKPEPWDRPNPPPASPAEAAARPQAWREMVQMGCLQYWAASTARPRFVSPCRLEPKMCEGQHAGWRFISNFRMLNTFLQDRPFKYDTLRLIPDISSRTDLGTVLDLSKFFFHFPLHPRAYQYTVVRAPFEPDPLAVGVGPNGHPVLADGSYTYVPGAYYHYACLSMGCKLSPYFAAKAVRFIQVWIAKLGAASLFYVDDWLLIACRRLIRSVTCRLHKLVRLLGFKVNETKGFRDPRRLFLFLGLMVDLQRRIFAVPAYKLAVLQVKCQRTLLHARTHQKLAPARAVAGLAGTAIPPPPASPSIPVFARSMFADLRDRESWSGNVRLSRQSLRDIESLACLSDVMQSAPFRPAATTAVITTDASTTGWGGWGTTPTAQLRQVSGFFAQRHLCSEINVLEMTAVIRMLSANLAALRGHRILLYTDNTSCMFVINKYSSRSPALMMEYRRLYALMRSNNNSIVARHIRTGDNVLADDLSRASDRNEYSWDPALVAAAAAEWQLEFSHDRFASDLCHQPAIPQYDTRWGSDHGSTMDTFTTAWTGVNWWTPPIALLADVLAKIVHESSRGVVLAPVWPAAPWFRKLQAVTIGWLPVNVAASLVVVVTNKAQAEPLSNRAWEWRMWYVDGRRT